MLENQVVEVWKDIYFVEEEVEYDYRGMYQVSNQGRVKSLKHNNIRILQGNKANKLGYLQVRLCKDCIAKCFYIHRLVAYMFIKNNDTENKTIVNHIDQNHLNNRYDNLMWADYTVNNNWGTRNKKLSKSKIGYRHSDETRAKMKANSGKSRKCFYNDMLFTSVTELAQYLNVEYDKLYRAIQNRGCYNGIDIVLLEK